MLRAARVVVQEQPPSIEMAKAGGWTDTLVSATIPRAPGKLTIEYRAIRTQALGAQPLHALYGEQNGTRAPSAVRQAGAVCNVYAYIVAARRPAIVIEFGSAFGVSGMYWNAALERQSHGHLYTFEINPVWAAVAESNIAALGKRFTLTRGSFEENTAKIPGRIDVCLIDAIHTTSFVMRQLEIVLSMAAPESIILFDDIDFSDDMKSCWSHIVDASFTRSACVVNRHLGVIQTA